MTAELKQPDDYGLWRFGIISPLLHRMQDGPPLRAQVEQLARRVFYAPDGTEKHLRPDTLYDWLGRYRSAGIEGLRNKPRKDRGSSSVPQALQSALTELRAAHPRWTVKRLLELTRQQGLWNGRRPSRSALYRFTAAQNLGRNVMQPPEPVRSFEFPFFGDLWSADFLHGPKVRVGTHARKSYLLAIIDDATRYIVAARFYRAENTRSVLDGLMLAIRRFGVPKRFYTDNGAAFRSQHLRLVAARLSIALPHTPPYMPRGRGKIERFFRTTRDSLLTGRPRSSLDKLNAELAAWVNQYHHAPHRGLGMSPLQRKLTDSGAQLKQIAATQDIDELFRMEQLKRVGPDGCIRMFGQRYEVPDAIPGTVLPVYYLPWDQAYILVGPEKRPAKLLDSVQNALRFDKPRRANKPTKEHDQ
jgi:transposase InsO family protein